MLIKLTIITSLLNITFLSHDLSSKKTMVLEAIPAKNAPLPELMKYYKYKITSDTLSLSESQLLQIVE